MNAEEKFWWAAAVILVVSGLILISVADYKENARACETSLRLVETRRDSIIFASGKSECPFMGGVK